MKRVNSLKIQLVLPLIIMSVLDLGAESVSIPANVCTDLASYSCADGEVEDGTGVTLRGPALQAVIQPKYEKTIQFAITSFSELVKNSTDPYFTELAKEAFEINNSEECTSKDPKLINKCNETLAYNLAITASLIVIGKKNIPSSYSMPKGLDLKFLGDGISHYTFAEKLEEIKKYSLEQLKNKEIELKISKQIFPDVKDRVVKLVSDLDIPENIKTKMLNKIKSIKHNNSDCFIPSYAGQGNSVHVYLQPNAYYSGSNHITICPGMFNNNTSEFSIVHVIAHEMAHSIDPCVIGSLPGFKYSDMNLEASEQEFPLKNLIPCLRGTKSINARNHYADELKKEKEKEKKLKKGKQSPSTRYYEPSLCRHDQIGEAFADWLAAEIIPEYIEDRFKLNKEQMIKGYSNVFRSYCVDKKSKELDVHPEDRSRINKILLVNPKVRKQMGCSEIHSDYIYCNINANKPSPQIQDTPSSKEVSRPGVN